ncbi:MAG TPA: serine hydrolase domain-containing protein [Candidatus Obscuribacter sp.]|nr:beta-lactamase family protein [Candidatus Obscuribacter sp.]HMW90808.1 serine hydrolase domain-containing protein [Candidatus Obscuribacter sp.]HMX44915.1 serine hydrolase domain-containing protein [Candidatus Obscuribacter sp.]HMY52754.1 serine hydrolase domain-containing protein [Candidatus Obscuribacter sp.]HNB16306.1 serine hydrolase domain-containing protein [Candidatus Obscuribacter sp.]
MHQVAARKLAEYLSDWLSLRYDQCDIPGFSVAVSIDGRLILNQAFGYADLEKKEVLTPEHLFRVASHSKTFAGTACMQLQEQGKLNIEAPVVQYLPWLKEHKDKRFQEITSRQLLSHSAGVIRDGLDADFWQFNRPFPNSKELQKQLLEAGLIFDCNTKMKYSNHGYGLLGLVIEAAAGQNFRAYVSENIIAPLALENTGADYCRSIENRLARGYTRVERGGARSRLDTTIDTASLSAATGFYSSAADLCRYFSAHIVGSGKLLQDASKKEMQRTQWPVTNSTFGQEYGLGLQIDYVEQRRVFGHAGGFPGHATRTLCDPADKMVVSVLTNCIDADPTAIARAVFAFADHFSAAYAAGEDSTMVKAAEASGSIDMERFRGRFQGLFRIMDVLPAGDKLIAISPSSWQPFADVEELSVVNEHTLKMMKANGFSCEGELVPYEFRGAELPADSIRCGGATLFGEKNYKLFNPIAVEV